MYSCLFIASHRFRAIELCVMSWLTFVTNSVLWVVSKSFEGIITDFNPHWSSRSDNGLDIIWVTNQCLRPTFSSKCTQILCLMLVKLKSLITSSNKQCNAAWFYVLMLQLSNVIDKSKFWLFFPHSNGTLKGFLSHSNNTSKGSCSFVASRPCTWPKPSKSHEKVTI